MKEKIISIEIVKDLNDISRHNNLGIYKQWLYNKEDYLKVCDYMQKINYAIQDLNNELDYLQTFDIKRIIFIIVVVDWIRASLNQIISCINAKVKKDFIFNKENELTKYNKFFKAIRSFVVAHPLGTTNHSDYGFDGDFICVDIRNYNDSLFVIKDCDYTLNINGLFNIRNEDDDFYLYSYSDKRDKMRYYKRIGCKYCDIYDVAKKYVEKLYALDKYLKKQKKKDLRGNNE